MASKKDGNMGNDTANDTGVKKPAVTQFQFAQKPEELSGWEGFKKFMWNKDTKQVMGRTGCSWCKYMYIYREVQLYFTQDMEVLHMLFERCHTKNRVRSLKQHIKYFNFRGNVQLDHPVF